MTTTSRLPTHASQFFGANVLNLIKDLGGSENYKLDLDDEVIERSLVVQDGASRWPLPELPPKEAPPSPVVAETTVGPAANGTSANNATGMILRGFQVAGAALLGAIALWAPADFVQHFTVFVLACFIGWQVVWNVSHALHTPLMSVTNAISGIIIVCGVLQVSSGETDLAAILGFIADLVASIKVVGGFWVTMRMLEMFRK